jgi:hypothetical protein
MATVAKTFETDQEIMARLRERFDILEDMTKAVKGGTVRAMIVSGAAGVGKSHGVEKVLYNHTLLSMIAQDKSLERYEVVKGAMTALGLYAKLYEYRHKEHILVFDDCDSVFSDELSLNIAKAALDSNEKRVLHWNADSNMLKEKGIPNSFEFCGGVIFITNVDFNHVRSKKLRSHLDALSSRCHYLDLTVHTIREQLLRIKQVVDDGLLDKYKMPQELKDEVVRFVCENPQNLRELSLRTVVKAAELAISFPDKWERMARVTLMK